ncbi:protein phosphatase 1 regulatory subunit 42 [Ciona intestinalis]
MVRLTAEYIARCNGHTKRKRDEPTNHYLKRITHLYMAERNIEAIDNLSQCRNLTVLYLYDNKLNKTMNLGTALNLTHLYLQNNNISKIEGLRQLQRLTKLYLGYNSLSVIEGLQSLDQLKELNVEYQRLPPGEKLLFEPRTLMALSKCLTVLNISGNHIDSLNDLQSFTLLNQLQACDNEITDFESLRPALTTWRFLARLDLTGNTVCGRAKYRDKIIVMSPSLESLDGKDIYRLERQFLMSWKASREARTRQRLESQKNGMDDIDLPPLHHRTAAPTPPPHYMMGGLPGGRKRFEAILAKSRSLPSSAMAPLKMAARARLAPHTTPAPPVNSTLIENEAERLEMLGQKSISDLVDRRHLERQMTPHPNATRQGRSNRGPLTSPTTNGGITGDFLGSGDPHEAENGKNGLNPIRGALKNGHENNMIHNQGLTRGNYPSLRPVKKTHPFRSSFNGAILSDSHLPAKNPNEAKAGDSSDHKFKDHIEQNGINQHKELTLAVIPRQNGFSNSHSTNK